MNSLAPPPRRVPRLLLVSNDRKAFGARLPLVEAARKAGYEVEAVLPPGQAIPGLTTHDWPLARRGMNPIREAAAIHRLTALYRRLGPDLVHHFTIKPVAYGGIAARRAGIPAVHTLTGLGYAFTPAPGRSLLRWSARILLKRSLAPARHVMFQNADDRRLFEALGILRSQTAACVVPGSGVDLERFKVKPEPREGCRVTYVGRFLADKGLRELAEAARLLREWKTEVQVYLVGGPDPGNPASLDSTQVQAWQQAGLVEVLPWAEDVRPHLVHANIVCLPSYREGVPRILLEAAACGRAVVATDVPGNRDAVLADQTGILVPPRNPLALAQAILQLARDANMRQTMGQAGRTHMERRFDQDQVHRQILDVYAAALKQTT